jgi:hypothetical protein
LQLPILSRRSSLVLSFKKEHPFFFALRFRSRRALRPVGYYGRMGRPKDVVPWIF